MSISAQPSSPARNTCSNASALACTCALRPALMRYLRKAFDCCTSSSTMSTVGPRGRLSSADCNAAVALAATGLSPRSVRTIICNSSTFTGLVMQGSAASRMPARRSGSTSPVITKAGTWRGCRCRRTSSIVLVPDRSPARFWSAMISAGLQLSMDDGGECSVAGGEGSDAIVVEVEQ